MSDKEDRFYGILDGLDVEELDSIADYAMENGEYDGTYTFGDQSFECDLSLYDCYQRWKEMKDKVTSVEDLLTTLFEEEDELLPAFYTWGHIPQGMTTHSLGDYNIHDGNSAADDSPYRYLADVNLYAYRLKSEILFITDCSEHGGEILLCSIPEDLSVSVIEQYPIVRDFPGYEEMSVGEFLDEL